MTRCSSFLLIPFAFCYGVHIALISTCSPNASAFEFGLAGKSSSGDSLRSLLFVMHFYG